MVELFKTMSDVISMVELECSDERKNPDLRKKFNLPGSSSSDGETVWILKAKKYTEKFCRLLQAQGHDPLSSLFVTRPKSRCKDGGLDFHIAQGGDRCLQVWVISEKWLQEDTTTTIDQGEQEKMDTKKMFVNHGESMPTLTDENEEQKIQIDEIRPPDLKRQKMNFQTDKQDKAPRALPILLREIRFSSTDHNQDDKETSQRSEWSICGVLIGEYIYNEYPSMSGLWLFFPQAEGEFMNDEFFQQLGYDRRVESEFPAHHPESWFELIDPNDLNRAQTCLNTCEATRGRIAYDLRVTYRRIDNTRIHLRCKGVPLIWSQDGKILAIAGCHTDITAESQERIGKISFIGKISHEIRTPLHAVFGAVSMLQDEEISDTSIDNDDEIQSSKELVESVSNKSVPKRRNEPNHTNIPTSAQESRRLTKAQNRKMALQILSQSIVQVNRVVNDVLDYSALSSGKLRLVPKPVSLQQLFNSVISMHLGDARAKNIQLKTNIEPNLPNVSVDAIRLTQIISNLISNSLKFTPDHGTIELIVGRTPLGANGFISDALPSIESQCFLTIDVRDTGCGIARSHWSKIFEDFEQAKVDDIHKGSGLGLAVVTKLVNLYSGQVFVHDSTLGQGTTIRILIALPIAGEIIHSNESDFFSLLDPPANFSIRNTNRQQQQDTIQPSSTLRKFSDICSRVLVVDDIQTNRFVLTAILRKLSPKIQVFEAEDGRGATIFVQNAQSGLHPPVDIILMDLHMPNMVRSSFYVLLP